MRFLATADETGAIKEVVCNRGTDTSKKDAAQPISIKKIAAGENLNIKSKILFMSEFNQELLVSARANGWITVNDLINESEEEEEQYLLLHTYKLDVEQGDKPVGLIKLEAHQTILVAFESRKLFAIHFNDKKFDINPIELELAGDKPIQTFAANPYQEGIFAFGGKENDVKIVKLFESKDANDDSFKSKSFYTNEIVFEAENVENDYLDLWVPVWISKILFFKDQPENGFKFVTATRHGQIRTYNTSEEPSPIGDYKICDKPLVSLKFTSEAQDEVIVTDTHNYVAKLSLKKIDPKGFRISSASAGVMFRPTTKLLGKFSEGGNTGAIFAVDTDLEERLIAFGGLDRYLRVFDIDSRKLLAKVYLGTQITDVLILDSEEELIESEGDKKPQVISRKRRLLQKQEEEEEESDEEDVWNQLEENSKANKKSKKTKKN